MTSKYVFGKHGFSKNSKNQITINLWHGVGHKKVNMARVMGLCYADFTIATSEFVQEMFANFFDVPLKSVLISGYQ